MKRASLRCIGSTLLFVAALGGLATHAQADAISYSLTLCEDLDVLKDPTNKTLAMNAGWKPQHTLMMERTSPYVELKNTSDSALITQLSMSIGDLSKNFDWAKMVEVSPGVSITVLTVDSVMGGTKSDTLTISFSGFAPGDFVRFRMGLSDDNPNASLLQDYRAILFHLDGNNPSSNSTVSVDFQSNSGTSTLTDQLPNFSMGGMSTSTSMAFPHQYGMDTVMPFQLTGSGSTTDETSTATVPEPASILLLGCGLAGFVACRFGRRIRA